MSLFYSTQNLTMQIVVLVVNVYFLFRLYTYTENQLFKSNTNKEPGLFYPKNIPWMKTRRDDLSRGNMSQI